MLEFVNWSPASVRRGFSFTPPEHSLAQLAKCTVGCTWLSSGIPGTVGTMRSWECQQLWEKGWDGLVLLAPAQEPLTKPGWYGNSWLGRFSSLPFLGMQDWLRAWVLCSHPKFSFLCCCELRFRSLSQICKDATKNCLFSTNCCSFSREQTNGLWVWLGCGEIFITRNKWVWDCIYKAQTHLWGKLFICCMYIQMALKEMVMEMNVSARLYWFIQVYARV